MSFKKYKKSFTEQINISATINNAIIVNFGCQSMVFKQTQDDIGELVIILQRFLNDPESCKKEYYQNEYCGGDTADPMPMTNVADVR